MIGPETILGILAVLVAIIIIIKLVKLAISIAIKTATIGGILLALAYSLHYLGYITLPSQFPTPMFVF